MRFIAGNAQHIGARQDQQDSFGFSDASDKAFVAHGGFLGVVADGMGGLTNGREASSTAVSSFLQAYRLKTAKESIPDALARSFGEANRAVVQLAGGASSSDAGTTIAAAVIHEASLYWISAGDSRVYWLQGNRLTRVTADHVYGTKLNREMAEGKISRADALNNPERGSLTSYLGQAEPELVDRNRRPLALRADDCVILCSDGLYRGLTEGEIVSAFRGDPQQACDSLIKQVLAKQRKQQDNLTLIALKSKARATAGRSLRAPMSATALLLVLSSAGAGYWYGHRSAVGAAATGAGAAATTAPVAAKPPASAPVLVNTPTPLTGPTGTVPNQTTTGSDTNPVVTSPSTSQAETKGSKKNNKNRKDGTKKTSPSTQGGKKEPPAAKPATPPPAPPSGNAESPTPAGQPTGNNSQPDQAAGQDKKPDQGKPSPEPNPAGSSPQKPDSATKPDTTPPASSPSPKPTDPPPNSNLAHGTEVTPQPNTHAAYQRTLNDGTKREAEPCLS